MSEDLNRRGFFGWLGTSLALPLLWRNAASADSLAPLAGAAAAQPVGDGPVVVSAPGIPNLPSKMVGGVREFQLTAEPVTVQFPDMSDGMGMKGRPVYVWGYNGSMIGPTIEANEGETVRVVVTNRLSEPTTVHFHGIELPIGMDGVPGFSQNPIPPGGSFIYEFTLHQSGTFFYHSHFMAAKQVGLGLMGFFIVHPKAPEKWQAVDHDYAYLLHTWKINPGSPIPDTLEMTDFNFFTMNGRVGDGVTGWQLPPMKAKVGERVRIRVANLSMLNHTVHLHGHTFVVSEWGGGFVPPAQQVRANTVGLGSAEVRTVEFTARAPGRWMFHCHFTHHTMTDMHRRPLPGTPPMDDMMNMDMGGMSTWIEVTG